MKRTDFDYNLPKSLIAKYPLSQRSASRLLVLDRITGAISHRQFSDLPLLLRSNDCLIFNDTKVISARVYGRKETGGKVEVLFERVYQDDSFSAQIRASKSPKIGARILLADSLWVQIVGRQDDFYVLVVENGQSIINFLQQYGELPLPPYLKRSHQAIDEARYQTVYAANLGAVAAPTAGLHFDDDLLISIGECGVSMANVTLHVGAGTFTPVRTEYIEDHNMHTERVLVSTKTAELVNHTKNIGGRVIAVGTTVVRSLETAAQSGRCEAYSGDSSLFIYPGYDFKVVDAIITNFHLPQSTLLMMISAFANQKHVFAAYQQAIAKQYRFFSYGDAMLISSDAP